MGSSMSLEEHVAQETRLLRRSERKIDRDIVRLEREKGTLMNKIKRHARNNDVSMLKLLIKQYLFYKNSINKLQKIKNHLCLTSQKFQLMSSTTEIHNAMARLTNLMKRMNEKMGLENVNRIIMEFDMETTKSETINESLDDLMDEDIDEDEEKEIIDSIFDEIGLDISKTLQAAPDTSLADLENKILEKIS